MSAFRTGRLHCYILRKSRGSFLVDITDCRTVGELREKIVLKHQNDFQGMEEHHLKIWKHYTLPKDLKIQLANLQLRDGDALNGAVLLSSEFSDACLGQIHVIAEVSDAWEGASKKRKIDNDDQENDENDTFTSLQLLWDCAWDNPASEAELFETRDVIRDGTLPDITVTPNKYRVLTIPGNVLQEYSVKSILIRPEYIIALTFAIFIAKGGIPSDFAEETGLLEETGALEDEEDDNLQRTSRNEWDSTMQPNPFSSLAARAADPIAIAYLGHPDTGKTLFLFFVLALRVLQSLPTIYMVNPDCIYIVDSKGVRKIPTKKFNRNLVTDQHWILVDSNCDLQTVPSELLRLGFFMIQTASSGTKMVEWWKKSPIPCTSFIMKEWSLPELIVCRTLQATPVSSEKNLESFLDRYLPSARDALRYASDPNTYDILITRELGDLTREKIHSIIRSGRSLNFDDEVSHHIVLVTPQTDRRLHKVEIPTRYLYDKLKELGKLHALDAAFLLYEAFKGVKETNAPAFIYEDLIGYQLPLGGQWSVVSMNIRTKKRKYVHVWTTGNEEGDIYLRLGQGAPFEFMITPIPSDTFGGLKKIFYLHEDKLVLETGFYIPWVKNEATFDGFAYDAEKRIAAAFQATVGKKHSVKTAGLEWLKGLGVEKVYYVGVTPVGQSLDLPFDPGLLDFVEQVYQLALEPICPKNWTS